jgi:hypothetical protein
VASGLYWAFQKVAEAIIIEDDCVPDLSFFHFSAESLERYRNDHRIMMISGNNFQNGISRTQSSYYFSRFPHCWGWATWRRAWSGYDFGIKDWQHHPSDWLRSIVGHSLFAAELQRHFDALSRGGAYTWDYQWMHHMFLNGGLSVVPNLNLVENVGFGPDATHTRIADQRYIMKASALPFPLRHPEAIEVCTEADEFEKSYLYR